MKADVVSKRYASAFYSFLKGSNSLEKVMKELGQLVEVIETSKDVNLFVRSPLVKTEEKILFGEALRSKGLLSSELFNFIVLLIRKNRLPLLPNIHRYMKYLEMEDRGEVYAEVTVPKEIDEETKDSIIKSLENISGKKIVLNIEKDPSIIAGFVARIKSNQLDASVKGQLKNLKESLVG